MSVLTRGVWEAAWRSVRRVRGARRRASPFATAGASAAGNAAVYRPVHSVLTPPPHGRAGPPHPSLGRVLVHGGDDGGGDALITYKENLLDAATATQLFRFCDSQVDWARETDDFGPQQRLSCFVGDQGCSFAYVGLFLEPKPWPEPVKRVRERLNALLR